MGAEFFEKPGKEARLRIAVALVASTLFCESVPAFADGARFRRWGVRTAHGERGVAVECGPAISRPACLRRARPEEERRLFFALFALH